MREASPSQNCCGTFPVVIEPPPPIVGTDLSIEENGVTNIPLGASSVAVPFLTQKVNNTYEPIELFITNIVDPLVDQIALEPTMTLPTVNGFSVELDGDTDTANYRLHWRVRVP